MPFIRPPGGIGDTPPLPYYLYCLIGIAWSLGVLLGGLEACACAAVRVRLPTRAEEGGTQGRNDRHPGEDVTSI